MLVYTLHWGLYTTVADGVNRGKYDEDAGGIITDGGCDIQSDV